LKGKFAIIVIRYKNRTMKMLSKVVGKTLCVLVMNNHQTSSYIVTPEIAVLFTIQL